MTRVLTMTATTILAAALLAGCGQGQSEDSARAEEPNAGTPAAATPVTEGKAQVAMASISVDGKLGCGHCNFEVKDECSLAMQAASGEVYLIEAAEHHDELMSQRTSQPAIRVEGTVAEVDGQKVIYADSFELE